MQRYTIDLEAVRGYIAYLKDYKRKTESARRDIGKKLEAAHVLWDDVNYELTSEAMGKIDEQLKKMFDSFDVTLKSLNELINKFDAYVDRRRR